jgi:hypothetical protein
LDKDWNKVTDEKTHKKAIKVPTMTGWKVTFGKYVDFTGTSLNRSNTVPKHGKGIFIYCADFRGTRFYKSICSLYATKRHDLVPLILNL